MPTAPAPAYRSRQTQVLLLYLALLLAFWLYTGFTTPHLRNWLAESSLLVSAVVLLVAFYRFFRFSTLAYTCFLLFLSLHIHGMHYSYPAAPAGQWLQTWLQLHRNPFDRLVHFSFGLLLLLPMRELAAGVLRLSARMQLWWAVELVLALSTLYELLEWLVAERLFPELGAHYLGYQGDIWDAQKDITAALAGGVLAVLFLTFSRLHKSG